MAQSFIKSSLLNTDLHSFINFAMEHDWIPLMYKCEHCQQYCATHKNKETYVRYCKTCDKSVSIFTNTVFSQSKIDIRIKTFLAQCCLAGLTVTQACNLIGLNTKNIYGFFEQLRQKLNYLCKDVWLEGEVEIDESLFARHKYHTGRSRVSMKTWVLGLKQRGSNKCRFFVVDNDRSANVLIPLIEGCVKKGSVLYTDKWAEYQRLTSEGFVHLEVNHTIQFVNRGLEEQGIKIHTQGIEATWGAAKRFMGQMNGCQKKHIQEFMNFYAARLLNDNNVDKLMDLVLNNKNYKRQQQLAIPTNQIATLQE